MKFLLILLGIPLSYIFYYYVGTAIIAFVYVFVKNGKKVLQYHARNKFCWWCLFFINKEVRNYETTMWKLKWKLRVIEIKIIIASIVDWQNPIKALKRLKEGKPQTKPNGDNSCAQR